ncbi:zinc finger protein VAR3, chloroplastic-like isoform X2 [Wolffia australiana]
MIVFFTMSKYRLYSSLLQCSRGRGRSFSIPSADDSLNPRLAYICRELEGRSPFEPSRGAGEGGLEKKRERRLEESDREEEGQPHRWPEWTDLVEALSRNGYLDRSDHPASSKRSNRVRTACLDYARDRSELIRYLSREDIHLLAGAGCPSSDRKVTNSAKRLRAYVGINEGKVCSSCRLRGSCERAYLGARDEEKGRTVDVMRILLTLGLDLETENPVDQPFLKKPVEDSARRMLRGMVELGMKGTSSPETRAEPNVLMKQGDWTCPKCGFLNFAKNVKCLRCDVVSEAKIRRFKEEFEHLPLKKGDWICLKCNFLNFAKNTRCLQCEEKPTGRQLNPGEWECASQVQLRQLSEE